ncbi:hypothetical protein A3Q56_07503 [Intoshia linei]|uniref:Uncharacterized protein n=1 Tax=Intoshia linei TaxID=1819745 RepID=A0A177ASI8_9BILA|nr:hypothetical protein A3Q56_07503 [Intoshia linei]
MSMYSSFVQELPDSLEEFKHEMEIYLDGIYDTNAIMKLFQCIVSNKEHSNVYIPKGLLKSFNFFNNKEFLKKHPNLPKFDIIKVCEEANDVFDLYHDAGYDSYATGNVFINQCIYAFIHQHESNKNVVLNMEQLFRVVEKDIKKPEKNKEKKFIYNIKLKLKEMDLDTIAFIIRKLHSSTTEIKSDNQILVVVFDSYSNSRFKKFLNQNQQHISFTEVIDDSLH